MNTDIASLQAFVCVAEQLHFGRAATLLHMSPPLFDSMPALFSIESRGIGGQVFVELLKADFLQPR